LSGRRVAIEINGRKSSLNKWKNR